MLRNTMYIGDNQYEYKPFNIIAAGTGNTPFISILYTILVQSNSNVPIHFLSVHSNKEQNFTQYIIIILLEVFLKVMKNMII